MSNVNLSRGGSSNQPCGRSGPERRKRGGWKSGAPMQTLKLQEQLDEQSNLLAQLNHRYKDCDLERLQRDFTRLAVSISDMACRVEHVEQQLDSLISTAKPRVTQVQVHSPPMDSMHSMSVHHSCLKSGLPSGSGRNVDCSSPTSSTSGYRSLEQTFHDNPTYPVNSPVSSPKRGKKKMPTRAGNSAVETMMLSPAVLVSSSDDGELPVKSKLLTKLPTFKRERKAHWWCKDPLAKYSHVVDGIDMELLSYLRLEFAFQPRTALVLQSMRKKAKAFYSRFDMTNWMDSEVFAVTAKTIAMAMDITQEEETVLAHLKNVGQSKMRHTHHRMMSGIVGVKKKWGLLRWYAPIPWRKRYECTLPGKD